MSSRRGLSRFLRAESGSAGFEMVLWLVVVFVPVANLVDIGIYVVQNLQVRAAAQSAAQSVRTACRDYDPPYTTNCGTTAIQNAATAGAQTGLLGTRITVDASYPIEGYYCATDTTASQLTLVGTGGSVSTAPVKPTPFNCTALNSKRTDLPGDYIRVKVNHTYTPMFTTVTVAQFFPSAMSATSWARMQ